MYPRALNGKQFFVLSQRNGKLIWVCSFKSNFRSTAVNYGQLLANHLPAGTRRISSSAQFKVNNPEASQRNMIPLTEGIKLVTLNGCTKIDAPMIVPTTRAVARGRVITRRNFREFFPSILDSRVGIVRSTI